MKKCRFIIIWDCWHCPFHYKSRITEKRRCAREGKDFDDEEDYTIPEWCTLEGKV
jgi:hypothetical protein